MSAHRVLRAVYVAAPTVLVLVGEFDAEHPRPPLVIAALVLCLPAIVVTLPVLYLGLALLWNVVGGHDGGTTWPITVAWVLVVAATAAGNLVLLERWRHRSVAAQR